jgi:Tol biopolymer transport system component
VITREDIQKRLWPENTYVDFDNAINSAVRKLRDALGDSPENPRFVETLARRGYRFIAPVSRPMAVHPFREKPLSIQSQTVPLPVNSPKLATKKRRIWWIACVLTAVFAAAGMGLRWWATKSDQAGSDTPLPAVPLTGNLGYEGFPTFSPEGSRVAFSWEQPGKPGPNIYVKLIGPGDLLRLTTSSAGDFGPAWSPDGRYVAFLRAHGPSHAGIMIIPAVGGQERELAEITFELSEHLSHAVPPPFLAWSADSRWLLSLEKAPHEVSAIVRISLETGEKRTLTSPPRHTNGDGSLAVSPDGKMLAFTRTLGLFERDIYIVSLSEDMLPRGKPRRLTFDDKEMDGLAWTPDGRNLVFSSTRGGRRELWQMPAMPSGRPVRLSAAGDDPLHVATSREGRHLVYSHQVSDLNIWRLSLNGEKREEASSLISSTRLEFHPRYSPDGQRIAFESNRSGNEEIWTCRADGSHPIQLTAFRNAWAGSPRWSPDGRKIAFDGNAAGNWDIYVIPSQGGKPTRLTKSETSEFRPSWSHDGKWIYYCSTRTGHVQVWKIPASGGTEVQVTTNGGGVAFESVNGEDLYYAKEDGLWKMPVRGGGETKVLGSLLWANFAPAKRGIYFLDGSPTFKAAPHLKLLDFTTHAIRTIAPVPGVVGDEISISPDEQWMLFDRKDREGSELMLVENFH